MGDLSLTRKDKLQLLLNGGILGPSYGGKDYCCQISILRVKRGIGSSDYVYFRTEGNVRWVR